MSGRRVVLGSAERFLTCQFIFFSLAIVRYGLVFVHWQAAILIFTHKQLLNEVEHVIENYQGRSLCYPPKPKADVDNTNRGLDDSGDIMRKPNSIIVLLCIQNQKTKNNTNGTHENFMPS